jgi:hemerythrin superfamily protein
MLLATVTPSDDDWSENKTRRKDIVPTLGNLGTTKALLNDDVAAFKVANFSVKVHFHFHKKKEKKEKKKKGGM